METKCTSKSSDYVILLSLMRHIFRLIRMQRKTKYARAHRRSPKEAIVLIVGEIFSFTVIYGPTAVLQLRRHTQQNSVTHVSITTKSSTVVHSVVWYSIHDDGKLFLTASWIDRDRLSAFPGTH
jgi:hypothetical protein